MGKIQLSISDVFRSEPCRPQWDYPVFIAVPDQLGRVIPSGFFSEIRPAAYKKVGYMLLVSVHYKPSWLSTKNRQLNLHFLPWPAVCAPTFFTLFWVNKKENIFDANHYIYKLECIL
ncbi:hypothetical protein LNO13_28875 [Klebsiella variicola subsp. variicola]|nr:hypothetical protein [Klebsiella variicola subsp. variicola]